MIGNSTLVVDLETHEAPCHSMFIWMAVQAATEGGDLMAAS
jgi:hypothetical protein